MESHQTIKNGHKLTLKQSLSSYIYRKLRDTSIAWGSVGSEETPSQRKVHYLVIKGPLFETKGTVITTPHMQGSRNWPDRLSSCQVKVSPTYAQLK